MKKFSNILMLLLLQIVFFARVSVAADLFITTEDVSAVVLEEFSYEMPDDVIELEYFGGQTNYKIEDAKSFKLMVSKFTFDPMSSKFTAILDVFVDGKEYHQSNLIGRYSKIIEVYIPSENIGRGEIITENLLTMVSMPQNKVKTMYVSKLSDILNMEAKKPLREGKLISARDIGRPTIIKKGQIINMLYKSKTMQIVAQGEALADGYEGQKLEVMNTKSKKSVFGIVIDKDNILVE